jgi:hypothetical protein
VRPYQPATRYPAIRAARQPGYLLIMANAVVFIAVFIGAAAVGRGVPTRSRLYDRNCAELGDAGVAALHQGDPGYRAGSQRKPTMAEETNDGADRS